MAEANELDTGEKVKTGVPFSIWANLSIFSVLFSVGSVIAGQSRNFGLGSIGLTNIINLPSEVIPPLGLFGSTLLFIPVCWLTIWYVKGEEAKLPSNKEHPAKLWRKRFPITENMGFSTPYAIATQYFWLIAFFLFPLIAQVQLTTHFFHQPIYKRILTPGDATTKGDTAPIQYIPKVNNNYKGLSRANNRLYVYGKHFIYMRPWGNNYHHKYRYFSHNSGQSFYPFWEPLVLLLLLLCAAISFLRVMHVLFRTRWITYLLAFALFAGYTITLLFL